MISRFSQALSLLWNNLGLFTAIILTVWLPGNILTNFVAYNYAEVSYIALIMLIEGIFGPLYIGALVYALYRIKMGHRVTYKEAIAVGFRKWGSLFAARFVAGILVGLGFFALIVPGIILAVRYSLLDAAVIIEGKGTSGSLARSIELTAGRRWQIFGAAIVFVIPFLLVSFLIYLPLGFCESLDVMPVGVALDCVLDIVYAVIQIVIFLFYWEAIQDTARAEPVAGADGVNAAVQP